MPYWPANAETEPMSGSRLTVLLASLGAFTVSLDSALNVAFPAISAAFDVSPSGMSWVVICYLLPSAILTVAGGTVGDRLGHHRVFAAGLWLSVVAYPLCGLAPTYGALLLARVLQGVGAGLVYGTAPALVVLAVAVSYRSRGLGVLAFAGGVGFAVAPLVAGPLIDAFGWRSVFLFRIPIALVVALAAPVRLRGLPQRLTPRGPGEAIPRLPARAAIGSGLVLMANAALFVLYMLAPYFLIGVLRYSGTLAGAVFTLVPLSGGVAGAISGWLARRVDPRTLGVLGLAIEIAGLGLVGALTERSSVAGTALALGVAGFGLGAFQVPIMALVMASVSDRHQGFAGGLVSSMRPAGNIASALLTPLLAFTDAVLACTTLCGLALAFSFTLYVRRTG
jgi:MFS family permease